MQGYVHEERGREGGRRSGGKVEMIDTEGGKRKKGEMQRES